MRYDQVGVLILAGESQSPPETPAVLLLDAVSLRRSVRET